MRTTGQGLRDRSGPELVRTGRAHEEVQRSRPEPSRCRIAYHRRTRRSSKQIREAVSDRGSGVRSRGERPPTRRPKEKGTATMKLTTTTMVTVDGVMQGLGGPDEDRSGGFERGGWVTHSFDDEAATFLNQVYQRADAFLFG